MPKGFNDKERQIIREALMEKGKNLFNTFGLRKTSIEELAKVVGISQGSFYNFFSSKEELYFDILENEENLIKANLLKESNLAKGSPKEIIKNFLTYAYELIDSNIFIKQLYIENDMEILVRKLPSKKFEEHKKMDFDILLELIAKWKTEEIIVDKESEVIVGLIRSVLMISLHKNQIGVKIYQDSVELLIEILSEGLANKEANL